MSQWNLIIDVAKCTHCNLCTLAIQDEYVGNEFPGYAAEMPRHGHRWIDIHSRERGQAPQIDAAYLPTLCNHCDDAPCMKAARNDAVRKRDDGIVIIDPEKAKGQKAIVDACPYGAVYWNEEKQLAQHWIFDTHLLDEGWNEPRCCQVCVTGAMRAVKLDDAEMQRIVASEALEVLHPEYQTRPRVYYKNLYRFMQCFIAGSLVAEVNGIEDCVEGARVSLYQDGGLMAEMISDNYGDFKFDRLDENSGLYEVRISADKLAGKSLSVDLKQSVSLGRIYL